MNKEEAIEHLKNMKMPHDKFYEETNEINKTLIDKGNEALDMAIESLKNQKSGHWIKDEKMSIMFDIWKCSECGGGGDKHFKYCSYCGAKMEGVKQ